MRDIDAGRLENACVNLGDTVIDPMIWPEIIGRIGRAVGAPTGGGLMHGHDPVADVPCCPGTQELNEVYFADKWYLRDLRVERGVPLALKGEKVIIDQDVVTLEEIKHAAIYNELERYGLGWFAAVTFRVDSEPQPWALTFHRTKREGPFETRDKRPLAQLSQRLADVASLSAAVGRVALMSTVNALDIVRQPAAAVDRLGCVLGTNAAAHRLFDGEIRVRDRRLYVTDRRARTALERFVDALRAAGDTTPLPTEPIVVRRQIKAPVLIRILPIEAAARSPFLGARALLLLLDLSERRPPQSELLVTLFGLTGAEAKLAALIGAGETIERAAKRLGIATLTARTQLKAVLSKTDKRRQAELVALIARLCGFS
jgi:DNA-binding CsgD family transcriptional regulator